MVRTFTCVKRGRVFAWLLRPEKINLRRVDPYEKGKEEMWGNVFRLFFVGKFPMT